MRFIIYGAGGVGGVIAAQLIRAGIDVVLIARGDHLEALRTKGLRLETPHEDVTIPVMAAGHPADVAFRQGDVVVLAMKSQHTVSALQDLRAAAGDRIPVICCQNGVANERAALRCFQNVYAMLVYLPAQFIQPGRIQCHATLKSGVLDIGRYPQGVDDLAAEISACLERGNISSRTDPNVMRFKFAKLLMNLGNGLEAVLPEGVKAEDILAALKDEGRTCFKAAGIDWAGDDEVKARRDGVFGMGELSGITRVGGSSRQSLIRGTGDIETDYLNGEIVLFGRLHDIPTPANTVIQRLSDAFARRRTIPNGIMPDHLRDLIQAEATNQSAVELGAR
jgi:2-dehydropantoate 2-reductase